MSFRWWGWLSFGLLALVLLAWLWPLLFGQTLFWGLPALQFYPWRSFAFDELRAGRLPLTNPYNGGGAPLLANYQVALLYPPNWLHMVLPHVPAMNLLAVGHIIWAALGMWVFTTAWRLPELGRGVSMLAFALGGYLVGRMGSFPTVAAASWLPWLFLAVHRLMTRPQGREVALLALVTALLLLSGHAQTAYYALLGAGAYMVWLTWCSTVGRQGWRLIVLAALGVLLAAGLAAAQLLPTVELLLNSDRASGLNYQWTTNFSYSLARALTLLSPNIYGTPANGTYITEGVYFEDAAYIGLLPLVAAGFAVVAWVRSRRQHTSHPPALQMVPFWAVLALVTFLVALGKNGPLFPLLYRFLPTFRSFQGPVRWLILTVFALSLLAGIGVTCGWRKGRWIIFWSRLIAAGGLGMAVVALLVAPHLLPQEIPALQVMIAGFATLGLFLSGCALLTLLQPLETGSRWRAWWKGLVLVFVAFDLFWAFRGLNPTVPAEFFQPLSQPEEGAVYMTAETERDLKFEVFFSPADYRVAVESWSELRVSLLPNLNMLDGVTMVNNFDPIITQAYAAAITALENTLPDDATIVLVDVPFRQQVFGEESLAVGVLISGGSLVICLLMATGRFTRFSRRVDGARIWSDP